MRLPRALAHFNKVVTNPIQGLWADKLPPWAVVKHVGRKSGKPYSIPVLAFVEGDKLGIILTYGRDTDWVRNVQAAGEFTLIRGGEQFRVTGPRVIPSDSPDVVKGAQVPARVFESVLYGNLIKE